MCCIMLIIKKDHMSVYSVKTQCKSTYNVNIIGVSI